ncbi:Cleavage polyadenylation factor subunit clp1 [Tulasnella sp. 419]|nr:Cleavage polyadenylation factor subunit clp1 [Tulasnella sp. 419]
MILTFSKRLEAKYSGIVIDTPSSFATAVRVGNEMKYPMIQTCVEEFGVNVIVVIGHEKLNVDMQRLFANSPQSMRRISVIKIPKSGGVVDLDHAYRIRTLSNQIRTYFYGAGSVHLPNSIQQSTLGGEAQTTIDLTLSPYSSIIKFTDLKIYRVGAESMAPSSALPIGASRVVSEMVPTRVEPSSPGVLNSILALLPPPPQSPVSDEEAIPEDFLLSSDVVGFLLV